MFAIALFAWDVAAALAVVCLFFLWLSRALERSDREHRRAQRRRQRRETLSATALPGEDRRSGMDRRAGEPVDAFLIRVGRGRS